MFVNVLLKLKFRNAVLHIVSKIILCLKSISTIICKNIFLLSPRTYIYVSYNFRLVVVCQRQIHVFSFPHSPQRLFTCETRDNLMGLCEVSPLPSADRHILCFPAHKLGAVQLVVRFRICLCNILIK